LPEVPPPSYWEGVTSAEAASTQLLAPTLVGSPGVVAPGSTVTVTINEDGFGGFESQFTPVSAADGSVSLPLPVSVSTVRAQTDHGTDVFLTFP